MITTIPFSGFYASVHDSALDSALESIFQEDSELLYKAHNATDWQGVHIKYAAEYAAQFADNLKLPIKFESMKSPLEYNFSTDIIYCTIAPDDAAWLFDTCDKTLLAKVAQDMFTSRSGFISFYSPDFTEWGDILDWDHNQIGALIRAIVAEQNPDFDRGAEFDLMENAACNGAFENWIFATNPKELNRLVRISEYVKTRAER